MRKAFTLVELGIVVAIIALCAMIVVPNFADSKSRANAATARASLRTAAAGLEAYAADNSGKYPYDGYNADFWTRYNYWCLPWNITTPVAYLNSSAVPDPFRPALAIGTYQSASIRYANVDSTWNTEFNELKSMASVPSVYYPELIKEFGHYRLSSVGPDTYSGPNGWPGFSSYPAGSLQTPYDPTNGLISTGDILRTQVCESGYLNMTP